MSTTLTISDVSKPGQDTYRCVLRRGNVQAEIILQRQPRRPYRGAYQMLSSLCGAREGGYLNVRQLEQGENLLLEAKGNLASAVYTAGWHSERVTYGGQEVVLWWPPMVENSN